MPMVDIFLVVAAEEAAAAAAATAVAEIGAEAAAASALESTAAAGFGAETLGSGILGAEGAVTPAQMATNAVAGGEGAGGAGINQAMVNAQQTQAIAPGAGYTPADINNAFSQINSEMTANPTQYSFNNPAQQSAGLGINPPPATVNNVLPGVNIPAPTAPVVSPEVAAQYPSLSTPNINSTAQGLRLPSVGQITPETWMPNPTQSGIKTGWDAVTDWMGKNPMTTGLGAYGILNATGALKPQNTSFGPETYTGGPLANYRLSPNFQTYPKGPNTNIYRPTYAAEGGIMQANGPVEEMSHRNAIGNNFNYPGAQNFSSAFSNPNTMPVAEPVMKGAEDVRTDAYTGQQQLASGGIVAFAGGGNAKSYSDLENNMNMYSRMLENPASVSPPASRPDVGIFTDSNPNTRKLSAADASLYQQKTLNNRFGIHSPVNLPSGAMGRINTVPVTAKQKKSGADDVEAAAGGIMQAQRYNLGGYAHGGNPRLLRGPGDGMSDNIPATIADTQPARLADGEFVIPADVVSGLGNGSTEAGAKHLHQMMDKVRMARTGTKKQGKQINASKFMPT